jgi:outer membrane protein insertion porin family
MKSACALIVSTSLIVGGAATTQAAGAQQGNPSTAVNSATAPETPSTSIGSQNGTIPVVSTTPQTIPTPPPSNPPISGGTPTIPSVPLPLPTPGPDASMSSTPSPTGRIAKITISGNVNITTGAIMALVSQKVGDPYDLATADKDREAIKNMGYFNGDIGLNPTQDPIGGVDVTYTVVENPVVKTISFTANTPSGEPTIPSSKLKSLMDTHEGLVLNTNTLVRDLDKLFNRQTGYARAQGYIIDVSSDINIDPLKGALTIPLIEAHIDGIQIKGNKKTKTVVLTRELHSKSGDVLDERKLQKDLTRIYNTGLFDQVGPFEEIPTDVGKVTISIPVVEKRSGQVSVGIGYSSLAKLVGRAELAENNFRGMGERVSLQWEVGGVSSASSTELSFFEPYLDKRHTSLSVDVFNKAVYRFSSGTFGGSVGTDNTYIEQRRGGTLGLNRPLSETFNAGISFRAEDVRANNVQLPPSDLFLRQVGSVIAVGINGTQNTRDVDLSPASGGLNSFSAEIGTTDTSTINNIPGELKPGRYSFVKTGIDLRRYISLQGPRKLGDYREPKKVFAVRLLLGATNRDTPFFEQYFIGGADSLRGTDTSRYWGNKLALFQSEVRIPLGKDNNIQGVIFSDMGDAWGSLYTTSQLAQHSKFTLTSDFGLGVRLVTPVGPIRLDYAFGQGGGRTQFSIGQSF